MPSSNKKPAENGGSVSALVPLVAYFRESFPVAFLNPAHDSEQMEIRVGPELFGLAVKKLRDERVENPDLLHRGHIAMNASECSVKAGEQIVNKGFLYGRIRVSHSYLSKEGDLWLGLPSCANTIAARLRYSTEKAKALKLGHYLSRSSLEAGCC
jgi:hypothetical protein